MKISSMLTFLLVMISNFSVAQTDQRIVQIRKIVQEINTDSNYTIKHLDNAYFIENKHEITDGGQDLKGYYKSNKLKKIIYSVGISYGVTTTEFYYSENRLVFVYELQKIYSHLLNVEKESFENDYSKFETVYEGRFYFDNSKLIETIIKGSKLFKNDKSEASLLKESNSFIRAINQNNKND